MALPFFNTASKKRLNQIMAIDLGSRTTKAVLLERRGEVIALTRYALLDAPASDKKISTEVLTGHLRAVAEALGGGVKSVALSVKPDDALVRQVELPHIPANEMRQLLRMNAKAILQQDLPNYVYDCYIFPPKAAVPGKSPEKKSVEASRQAVMPKLKVLVAGAKQQLMEEYRVAV